MNRRLNLIILVALLLQSYVLTAQDKASETVARLGEYMSEKPQEKLFIHLDKPFYANTDDIWFKVYLVDAINHLPRKDALAYVELLDNDGELVASRNIQILDGGGFGDFDLEELELPKGDYVVRGYTNYMRNFDDDFFFHQKLKITDSGEKATTLTAGSAPELSLQFFPEGGELVAGEVNYVAAKATNSFGESVDMPVTIVDGQGDAIKQFETGVFGMGKFPIIPQAGQSLFAKTTYQGKDYQFPLPAPLSEGYLLSVRNNGPNIVVIAKHSEPNEINNAYMVVHQRGKFLGVIKADGEPFMQSAFKSAELPSGVITFTLFNEDDVPVRERVAFVDNQTITEKRFAIEADKETYRNREKVVLYLEELIADSKLAGTASVSITNTELVPEDARKTNLMSHLLLSSDIKGEIENPAYYFDRDNKDRVPHLDLLMMTQGWRRFTWEEVLKEEQDSFDYLVEKGFDIEGRITKFENRNKPVKSEVRLSFVEDLTYEHRMVTDENGYFFFKDVQVGDTVNMVIQARKADQKRKRNGEYAIELLRKEKETLPLVDYMTNAIAITPMMAYQEAVSEIESIDEAFRLDENVMMLGEVSVRRKRDYSSGPFAKAEWLYGKPSRRVMADSVKGLIPTGRFFDLLRNTAGVRVRGVFPSATVTMRGNNSINSPAAPLFMLDGVWTDLFTLSLLFITEIHHIDIIRGPDAAVFGSVGTNGVIAVYTKRGSGVPEGGPRTGIVNIPFAGFTVAREFYTPDYSIADSKHRKPDYRSTLYWNPTIDLSRDNAIEFYTSDEDGTYEIHLEGITSDGKVINESRLLEVK